MYTSLDSNNFEAQKIRILLVDDHSLVTHGIARMMTDEPDMEVMGKAGSGEEALQILEHVQPDVVLMDVKMPGMGGIEATARITDLYPAIKVVGMSSVDVGVIPSRMLAAGARAFITKSAGVDELMQAVRKVYAGHHYVSPSVATKLATDPFLKNGRGEKRNKVLFDKLSKRELQIAMMLSDGTRVSGISELLKISPKTVYTYRYRIFEKLGIQSDVELTILAMKNGVTETSEDYIESGEHRRQQQTG